MVMRTGFEIPALSSFDRWRIFFFAQPGEKRVAQEEIWTLNSLLTLKASMAQTMADDSKMALI